MRSPMDRCILFLTTRGRMINQRMRSAPFAPEENMVWTKRKIWLRRARSSRIPPDCSSTCILARICRFFRSNENNQQLVAQFPYHSGRTCWGLWPCGRRSNTCWRLIPLLSIIPSLYSELWIENHLVAWASFKTIFWRQESKHLI